MSDPSPPQGLHWVQAWTRDQGAAKATSLFSSSYGERPDGVWSVPGRVNIIGEHTDYSRGLSLPTVLPHRTYVAARLRSDDNIRVVSDKAATVAGPEGVWEGTLSGISPTSVSGWPAYVAGALWALQEHGFSGRGLDIAIASCLPVGSGMAASAALSCSTALAVNALWRLALDNDVGRIELAEACTDGDNQVAGAPTGNLDHHAVLRCMEGEALLMDFSTQPPTTTRCPLYFPDYGLALLVIDTADPHDVTDGRFAARRQECEQAARSLGLTSLRELNSMRDARERIESLEDPVLLRRARHAYTENERAATVMAELSGTAPAHERFISIGKALFRSHASLDKDLEVTTPALNTAVDAAFHAGALGARAIGAGFGGSAMALIRRNQAERIAQRIHHAFVDRDLALPQFLLV